MGHATNTPVAEHTNPAYRQAGDGFVGEDAQSGFDGDSYPGSKLELAQR